MLLDDVLDQICHTHPILLQAGTVVVGMFWDFPRNTRANIDFPSDLTAVWSEIEYDMRTIGRDAGSMIFLHMITVFLGVVGLKLARWALKLNLPVVL